MKRNRKHLRRVNKKLFLTNLNVHCGGLVMSGVVEEQVLLALVCFTRRGFAQARGNDVLLKLQSNDIGASFKLHLTPKYFYFRLSKYLHLSETFCAYFN